MVAVLILGLVFLFVGAWMWWKENSLSGAEARLLKAGYVLCANHHVVIRPVYTAIQDNEAEIRSDGEKIISFTLHNTATTHHPDGTLVKRGEWAIAFPSDLTQPRIYRGINLATLV